MHESLNSLTLKQKRELLKLFETKRKRELESSFYEFVKEAFEVLHPGQKINDNWHIKVLCERLEREVRRIVARQPRERHLIINIPPRSLKSIITTICLPAWAWVISPRLKFIGSSYSDTLSIEHNVLTRRLVESDWFKFYWGDTVKLAPDQNTKSKFENTEQGFRSCTSTGGTITGTGGDIIIIDDPINPKKAASEVERKNANDFFDQTLSTRLNEPELGVFIVIMQRLHEEDLTGHLLKKNPDYYEHLCIPAEVSQKTIKDIKPPELLEYYKEGLFFQARFTRQVLENYKSSLGSFGYANQFGQKPADEAGGTIKKAWFKKISFKEFQESIAGKSFQQDIFLDTGYTDNKKNDPTAFMAAVYCDKKLYILESIPQHLEFPELITFTPKFVSRNALKPSPAIRIEPKASGKSTKQTLSRNGFNAIDYYDSKSGRVRTTV
jgi:hypothetical protein